jgi:methylated-DNA-[protein]-cysteine S-methyltransferase
MEKLFRGYYDSKIGILEITGTEKGVTGLRFVKKKGKPDGAPALVIKEALEQLEEYFAGSRKDFTVKLILEGTDFQKRVWKELMKIPYASTLSYKDIAKAIGNEKSVRAVGGANGRNNIVIIVPCHRVITSDGTLGGFGGGLWRKEWLLKHEKEQETWGTLL